jgi:type II secretory pathway pseudopilin PulG
MASPISRPDVLKVGVIVVILVAVVYGLFLSGIPTSERQRRLDERRVVDLQSISNAIDQYYSVSGKRLPVTLEDMQAYPSIYIPSLVDPVTGAPYEYSSVTTSTYELCAMFDTEAVGTDTAAKYAQMGLSTVWVHPTGRTCFSLKAHVIPAKSTFIPMPPSAPQYYQDPNPQELPFVNY